MQDEIERSDKAALSEKEKEDVFLGRGGNMNRLRQGTMYRKLIEKNFEAYSTEQSKYKRNFVYQNIVLPVRQAGGKFRVFDKKKGYWVEANWDIVITTTMQSLRDCNRRPLGTEAVTEDNIKTNISTSTLGKQNGASSSSAGPPKKRKVASPPHRSSSIRSTPKKRKKSSQLFICSQCQSTFRQTGCLMEKVGQGNTSPHESVGFSAAPSLASTRKRLSGSDPARADLDVVTGETPTADIFDTPALGSPSLLPDNTVQEVNTGEDRIGRIMQYLDQNPSQFSLAQELVRRIHILENQVINLEQENSGLKRSLSSHHDLGVDSIERV